MCLVELNRPITILCVIVVVYACVGSSERKCDRSEKTNCVFAFFSALVLLGQLEMDFFVVNFICCSDASDVLGRRQNPIVFFVVSIHQFDA